MVSGIQIGAFLIGLYYIYRSYKLVSDKKGEVRQFLLGSVLGLLFIVVGVYPDVVLVFSRFLGMSYRGNTIFASSILLAYIIILHMSEKISELNTNISQLNEELALLRYHIEKGENTEK